MQVKKLGDEINKLIINILRNNDPILAELIVNWSRIVGTKFSTKTHPIRISRMKEKGVRKSVLLIGVENSSISLELSFQQDIIIERLAIYLGYKAVDRIRILVV